MDKMDKMERWSHGSTVDEAVPTCTHRQSEVCMHVAVHMRVHVPVHARVRSCMCFRIHMGLYERFQLLCGRMWGRKRQRALASASLLAERQD